MTAVIVRSTFVTYSIWGKPSTAEDEGIFGAGTAELNTTMVQQGKYFD